MVPLEAQKQDVSRSRVCSNAPANMAANMSKQLLSRLKKVAREWPVDPSRQGRDLGEYLRTVYHKKFESLVENDIDQALRAVQSLEKLNSNYYHHLYPRVREYGFTGDMAVNNPWILSNSKN